MDSKTFTNMLHQTFAEAHEFLLTRGYKGSAYFIIRETRNNIFVTRETQNNLFITVADDHVSVAGNNLGDCLDEFLRRIEFHKSQSATLTIGNAGEDASLVVNDDDDVGDH